MVIQFLDQLLHIPIAAPVKNKSKQTNKIAKSNHHTSDAVLLLNLFEAENENTNLLKKHSTFETFVNSTKSYERVKCKTGVVKKKKMGQFRLRNLIKLFKRSEIKTAIRLL